MPLRLAVIILAAIFRGFSGCLTLGTYQVITAFSHRSHNVMPKDVAPADLSDRIMALFQTREALSRKEIESMLDISQTSAINGIRALLEQGRIIRRGTGKNTRYVRG